MKFGLIRELQEILRQVDDNEMNNVMAHDNIEIILIGFEAIHGVKFEFDLGFIGGCPVLRLYNGESYAVLYTHSCLLSPDMESDDNIIRDALTMFR